MPALIRRLGSRTLVELGAGSAEKSRIILDAMRDAGTAGLYVPIDVSATFLAQTAAPSPAEYPTLAVEPAIADIAEELNLPRRLPRPALFAFLGSTIGNFYPPAAIRLLRECAPRWRRATASSWAWTSGRMPPASRRRTTTLAASPPSSTATCCWC